MLEFGKDIGENPNIEKLKELIDKKQKDLERIKNNIEKRN